jgi:hypothetical protein
MSTLVAEPTPADASESTRRRSRFATPPEWLWPVSIALQVLSAAALTAYTYFLADDWLFIAQARRIPLSIHYLRMSLFEHFSPITRLLNKLLIHDSTGSFALAHGLMLLMYAAAIVAFAFVARTILGNRWSAFALTVVFGQSLFLLRLLNWWTATANILPATIFGLLTIGAYLRWQRGGSRGWAITSLVSFAVSLLAYETAILVPFYLLVVRLLVLEDELRPRAWLAALRREWPVWVGYLALEVAALINFYSTYYYPPPHHASLGHLLDFLVIAVFGTFIPALFGIKNPQSPLGRDSVVVIGCVVLALALVAYLLYARPRAWRAVLAFALFAPVTMLPVGIPRVADWGVHIGKELYYQQSLQFMFLILVALAVRSKPRRRPPPALTAAVSRLRAPLWAGGLLAAVVAAYAVLFVTSVDGMAKAGWWWNPHRARDYVKTFQASARSTTERTGREPVLFNAQVAADWPGSYASYDVFFPMVDTHVRFNTVTDPMYVVSRRGDLMPVRFQRGASGQLAHARLLHPDRPAPLHGGAACTPTGAPSVWVRVPLSGVVRTRSFHLVPFGAPPLPRALRLFLRMPAWATVTVMTHSRRATQKNGTFPPNFGPGMTGQYVPLYVNSYARAVDLRLPGGACVESLAVGSFKS